MVVAVGVSFGAEEMTIERLDPAIGKLIPADAKVEIHTTGYKWMEGPGWREVSAS